MTSIAIDQAPAAICLDMDGTLVDTERLWDIAVYELAEHMGRPLDEATRERTLGNSLQGSSRSSASTPVIASRARSSTVWPTNSTLA